MPETIADNVVVTIEYTLKNSAGEVLDSSVGDEPLTYLHGHQNIVPGLEGALAGKKAGDAVSVAVPPEEGYGVRDPGGLRQIERDAFPADAELEPGSQFTAELEDDEVVPLWIVAVDDDFVHVDMNHPLAGETLHFEVKILELREALANELAHGHPHGREGHEHHHH
jgi:FKBP-type peptidyl-prolyl cis-trans isomerase SlyD